MVRAFSYILGAPQNFYIKVTPRSPTKTLIECQLEATMVSDLRFGHILEDFIRQMSEEVIVDVER